MLINIIWLLMNESNLVLDMDLGKSSKLFSIKDVVLVNHIENSFPRMVEVKHPTA